MELNRNSFSARVYRAYYQEEIMPNNLCSYFWSLVLAYITFIPLEIWGLPYTILSLFIKKAPKVAPFFKAVISLFMLGVSVALWLALAPITQYINIKWTKKDIECGIFLDIIIFIIIMVYYIPIIRHKFKYKSKNLVIEYLKSKISGICPRITWTDKK